MENEHDGGGATSGDMAEPKHQAKPFLFDVEFGEGDFGNGDTGYGDSGGGRRGKGRRAPDAPSDTDAPPPPVYSREELEAARQEGYRTGHEAAAAEGEAALERRVASVLSQIQVELSGLADEQHRANAAIAREATRVALTVVRKLLPAYAERHGLAEIEAIVAGCMEVVPREGEIVVSVAEGLAEATAGRLEPIASAAGHSGGVRVQPDPALGPAECRVQWNDGGAERREARIWEEVEAVLARTLPHVGEQAGTADAVLPEAGGGEGSAAAHAGKEAPAETASAVTNDPARPPQAGQAPPAPGADGGEDRGAAAAPAARPAADDGASEGAGCEHEVFEGNGSAAAEPLGAPRESRGPAGAGNGGASALPGAVGGLPGAVR